MEGACRRDRYEMARMARAVWAGCQMTSEGVDRFVASILDQERTLPAEQAIFALQAVTADLPRINLKKVNAA